jgi:hypothetical protein
VNQERFTKWLLSASSGKNLPEESPVHAITPLQNTTKPVQTRNKDSSNEHILLLNWSEFRFLLAQAFESLERRLFRRVFLHDTLVGDLVHLFVVNGNSLQFDLDLVGQNVAGFVYQPGFSPEAETLRFDLVVDVVKMVGAELVYAFWRHSGFFQLAFCSSVKVCGGGVKSGTIARRTHLGGGDGGDEGETEEEFHGGDCVVSNF